MAGYSIPLIRCTCQARQATGNRGRAGARGRRLPVAGEADVPPHQGLDTWAAGPHKQQQATIIFHDADAGTVLETLHLPAAYCTSYREQFGSGEVGSGAYRCCFTLADPNGWTLQAGALPNPAARQPPAREHGTPPALALGAAALGGVVGVATPFVVGPDG